MKMDQINWDFLTKGVVDYADQWFLMSSPIKPILILSAYLLFVLKIGPAYMKDRPAYSFKNILHIYNAAQVLYSAYLVYLGSSIIIKEGFVERQCMLEDEAYTYMISHGAHCYLIAKFSELLDTIFFVLRKKSSQITFLHVYHHSIMFLGTWCVFKYTPSFLYIFMGTLNSFVHVVMYSYYGLSAFPGLREYLWWKKYITKMQLVQFMVAIVQININFFSTKCSPSKFLLYLSWSHFLLFTYLFGKFYIESYLKNKSNTVSLKMREAAKSKQG